MPGGTSSACMERCPHQMRTTSRRHPRYNAYDAMALWKRELRAGPSIIMLPLVITTKHAGAGGAISRVWGDISQEGRVQDMGCHAFIGGGRETCRERWR